MNTQQVAIFERNNHINNVNDLFIYKPNSFEQAMNFAKILAESALVPECYKHKPADIFIASQMGARLGLDYMQSVQNIAVIRNRPCLWGDAIPALILSHPDCEDLEEWMEGSIEQGDAISYCSITRRGKTKCTRSFSIADARKQGLWGKTGPWSHSAARMLKVRARTYAARDIFADALYGLSIAEEVNDYGSEATQKNNEKSLCNGTKLRGIKSIEQKLGISTRENIIKDVVIEDEVMVDSTISKNTLDDIKKMIDSCSDNEELKLIGDLCKELTNSDRDEIRPIFRAKQDQLSEASNILSKESE